MRRVTAAVIGAAVVVAALASPARADEPTDPPAPAISAQQCIGMFAPTAKDKAIADDLMAGHLAFSDFSTWDLPDDPTWAEDPYTNTSWQFRLHNLTWIDPLRRVGLATGDDAMLARYRFLLTDWIADNPFADRSVNSRYAWYDMSVGLRGIGLTCASTVPGDQEWLDTLATARTEHARVLSDPAEYAGVGNHSLWQNMGLLALGCGSDVAGWRTLATDRSAALLGKAVDSEGVTDEGSVIYQYLNYTWWRELERRMQACALPTTGIFDRIGVMPDFIGQATMPNGDIVPFGDANAIARTGSIPGTAAHYAATQGKASQSFKPRRLFSVYQRGYVFSRTGWFDTQSAARQAQVAMRFGPSLSTAVHGHEDLGAINYFARGKHLLWQPGQWGGAGGPQRL